jgi:hypothetical protein
MYDMATKADQCEPDMKYDNRICAYERRGRPTCSPREPGVERELYLQQSEEQGCCAPLDGCGSSLAYAYFIAFTLLVTFVFVNLFIAVIIDGFNAEHEQADESSVAGDKVAFTEIEYEKFCRKWQEIDHNLDWLVDPSQLSHLFATLDEPMGLGLSQPLPQNEMLQNLAQVPACKYAPGYYAFDDVAQALSKRVMLMEFSKDWNDANELRALEVVLGKTQATEASANLGNRLEKRMKAHSKKGLQGMSKREKESNAASQPTKTKVSSLAGKSNKVAPVSGSPRTDRDRRVSYERSLARSNSSTASKN